MAFNVQILSIDASDSSPCIVIGTSTQRFLFESGEGTQRLCLEHKVKLARLNTIFITQLCPSRITGLPGLMLTTADIGKASLNIVGPIGIKKVWDTTRYFYYRPNFLLNIIESDGSNHINSINDINSDELKVYSIPIIPNTHSNDVRLCFVCETYKTIGKFDVAKALALNVPKGPLFGKLKNGQSITLDNGNIIKPEDVLDPDVKGRFALIICNLSDTFSSNDKISSYLESFTSNPSWLRFQNGSEDNDLVDCIVHMSPIDIMTSTTYQSWMMLFGDKVEHLFVGKGACEPHSSFIAATKYINKLNKISSIFPKLSLSNGLPFQKPHDDNELLIKINPSKPLTKFNMLPSKIRGFVVPTELFDSVDREVNEFWESAKANTNTVALKAQIENVQKATHSVNSQDDSINPIMDVYDLASEQARMCMNYGNNRIWFLGTGSAVPSKYRNVSGILLQIYHTKSSILLDVGEGTWQQMMKMALNCHSLLGINENISMGTIDTDRIGYELAVQIKAAWISHPHADHHLGLIRLLSERKRLLLKYGDGNFQPLVLIAPASVLSFVRDYEAVESSLKDSYLPLSTRMFDSFDRCTYEDSYWFRQKESNHTDNNLNGCESTVGPIDSINPSDASFLSLPSLKAHLQDGIEYLKNMGIEQVSNVKVVHCNESYGVAITLVKYGDLQLKPFKLVYSGDTRPCRKLTELGQGATLLIHEATFDDTKEEEAKNKRHSTINEALSIASDMKVFRVILTHFSQRYPKIPPIPTTLQTKTVLAFDYMHVSFSDLLWAPATVPALSEALPPEEEEDDDLECTANSNCNCMIANCYECKVQPNNKDKRKNDDILNKSKKKIKSNE